MRIKRGRGSNFAYFFLHVVSVHVLVASRRVAMEAPKAHEEVEESTPEGKRDEVAPSGAKKTASKTSQAVPEGTPLVETLAEQLRLQLMDVASGGEGQQVLKETLEGQLKKVEEERDKLDQLRADLGRIAPGEYAAYRKERESREQLVTALSAAIEAAAYERERRMLAAELARRRREQLDGLLQPPKRSPGHKKHGMKKAALGAILALALITTNKMFRAHPRARQTLVRKAQGLGRRLGRWMRVVQRRTIAFLVGPQTISDPPRRRRRATVSEENFEQWLDTDVRSGGNQQDQRSPARSRTTQPQRETRAQQEQTERGRDAPSEGQGRERRELLDRRPTSPDLSESTPSSRRTRASTPEAHQREHCDSGEQGRSARRRSLDERNSAYFHSTIAPDLSSTATTESGQKVPHAFLCPITREVMKNPVIAADGYSYERGAIKQWLEQRGTSPITNLPLHNFNLVTNHSLRSAIHELHL